MNSPAPLDIKALLVEVVEEVFGAEFDVSYESHARWLHDHTVTISTKAPPARSIEVRATYEWVTLHVPSLNVGWIDFEYEEDKRAKRQLLLEHAHAARAYLDGHGVISRQRRFFREHTHLTLDLGDSLWVLGESTQSQRAR